MTQKTKYCPQCNQTMPVYHFSKSKKAKDGLQHWCKSCFSKRYKKNQTQHNAKVQADRSKNIERNRNYILKYLQTHPCAQCGETDPLVLEFDHITGEKRANIANMLGTSYSLQSIKEEVAKCQTLCANCHRRKTSEQYNWWIWKRIMPSSA